MTSELRCEYEYDGPWRGLVMRRMPVVAVCTPGAERVDLLPRYGVETRQLVTKPQRTPKYFVANWQLVV